MKNIIIDNREYKLIPVEKEEKDYEILLVSSKGTGKIYDYNNDWFIGINCYIHSVKRLSDGEIFFIGDKVKQSNVIHNNTFIIKAFELDVNNKHLLAIGNGGIKISKIEKFKPILFTTEDGVDIYEGDSYTIVRKGTVSKSLTIFTYNAILDGIWKNSDIEKIFSSREAAVQYIIYNKPCLSINDVTKNLEAFKNNKFILNELKQLVKSKL